MHKTSRAVNANEFYLLFQSGAIRILLHAPIKKLIELDLLLSVRG